MPNGIPHIEVVSFGYKFGFPVNATLVIDVRFLENPYYDEALRPLTGADRPVQEFIERQAPSEEFLVKSAELMRVVLPGYFVNRLAYGEVVIAFGCSGGKHRSRYCAIRFQPILESLLGELAIEVPAMKVPVVLMHRDVGKE